MRRKLKRCAHVVSDVACGSKTNQLLGHSFPAECNSNVQGPISILKNQKGKVTIRTLRFDIETHQLFWSELNRLNLIDSMFNQILEATVTH